MTSRFSLLALGLLLPLSVSWTARAEDQAPTADVKPVAPLTPEKVQELIKQLDAAKFGDRQTATQKLTEAGAAVIPALAEAAMNGTRETTSRAIEILKGHFQGTNEATKKASEDALRKIADSGPQSAASRAKDALLPKAQPGNPQIGGIGPGGIRIFNGNAQIQIQVQAIGGNGAKRVSIKNVNGVKEIEAEEANRKIKITDDPNNGIKIEITETKDGKETTRKIEAKDADDLKKKDPDAHKDYEKYSKGNGGIQIQGIQIQGGALPIPIQPGQIQPFQIRPARIAPADMKKRLEDQIKRYEEQVEKAKAEDAAEEIKQKKVESYERVIKILKGQLERIPAEEPKAEEKPAEGKPAEAKPLQVKPVEIEEFNARLK